MENNSHTNGNEKSGLFSLLYRTRFMVTKGETTIVNLSVLFAVIALLCAPWLVVIGAVIALALGYHFAIKRNDGGFGNDFEKVVKDAANNVKHAVQSVVGKPEEPSEPTKPDHDENA